MPSAAKIIAATACTARTGSFSEALLPSNTAGTFATIMPRVVPMTTKSHGRNLGLVSHLRQKERHECGAEDAELGESRLTFLEFVRDHQTAITRKDIPSTQRMVCGVVNAVIQLPSAPAKPWLATVAANMPRMIGWALRKRAARISAKS